MMKRQYINEEWNEYARQVLPANCGTTQRTEMRRAFFAGAGSIVFRMLNGITEDREPTEADLQMMADIRDELRAYAKAVARGEV